MTGLSSHLSAAREWLDERTGYRSILSHLLDERLPHGAGWAFTLGSVLLLLLGVQAATGVVLMMYYVPAPDFAWDSLKLIVERVQFGRIVRNLHAFGASAIVIAAGLHLLRTFVFGSYKRPREATWLSGVFLLLVIMAFALTGYLLPWDQRAYWATVVTLNIARSAPFIGEFAANLLRGGTELGALTLSRWYAVHVAILPLGLIALVVAHLALMRRHGISGPTTPRSGAPVPFYPDHAVRDAVVCALVFGGLLALAIQGNAPLEPVADPTDPSYVPRPEWYFLWLFQLLKYFPGRSEIFAAHGVPAIVVGLLLLLPFLDRSPERRPRRRRLALAAAGVLAGGIMTLTVLGLRDVPATAPETQLWTVEALGGKWVASQPMCVTCHRKGGVAPEWVNLRLRHHEAWISAHVIAPDRLVPEMTTDLEPITAQRARAVTLWTRAVRRQAAVPATQGEHEHARALIGANCLGCHVLDTEGHRANGVPTLNRTGRDRDAAWLTGWIADPRAYEFDSEMPGFANRLRQQDITAIAKYLETRK